MAIIVITQEVPEQGILKRHFEYRNKSDECEAGLYWKRPSNKVMQNSKKDKKPLLPQQKMGCRFGQHEKYSKTTPRPHCRRVGRLNYKRFYEDTAVWTLFHGRIPPGMIIKHKNGNLDDNAISNLELAPQTRKNRLS